MLFAGQPVVPNNKEWVPAAADPRHHRLSVFHGGIRWGKNDDDRSNPPLDETPPPDEVKLCVELYSGIRLRPNPDLPVWVSVQSDFLAVTFLEKRVDVSVRPGRPCVRITVQGPLVHAPASAGETDWLPIVESVQTRVGIEVEEIEAPLSYSFAVCLPGGFFERIDWYGLPNVRDFLNGFELPLFQLPDLMELPSIPSLLPALLFRFGKIRELLRITIPDVEDFDFSLPDVGPLPRFPGFSVKKIEDFIFELEKIAPIPGIPPLELPKIPGVDKPDLGRLKLRLRPTWEPPATPTVDGFEFRAALPDIDVGDFIFFDSLKGVRLPNIKVGSILSLDQPLRIQLSVSIDAEIDPRGIRVFLKRFGPIFSFRIIKLEGLELTLELEPVSLELWDINAKVKLPEIRVREFVSLNPLVLKLDRPIVDIDLNNVQFRFWRPGLLQMFGIKDIDLNALKITLDLDIENPKLPKLDGFDIEIDPDLPKLNYLIDFFPDIDFPLTKAFFKDLLGDLPSVDFRMGIPDAEFQRLRWKLGELDFIPVTLPVLGKLEEFKLPIPSIPFNLSLRIPKPDVDPPDFPVMRLWLGIPINLMDFRLPSFSERPELPNIANRIYFYFPQWDEEEAKTLGGKPSIRQQAIDMDIMTLSIPLRENITTLPNHASHDGYLDIGKREFVIALQEPEPKSDDEPKKEPPPKMLAYFPGGVDEKAVRLGIEEIERRIKANKLDEDKILAKELKRRFQLELKKLDAERLAGYRVRVTLSTHQCQWINAQRGAAQNRSRS